MVFVHKNLGFSPIYMIVFQTRDPIDENHPKMLQVLKDFSENSVTGDLRNEVQTGFLKKTRKTYDTLESQNYSFAIQF